ncbi:MAG TPA: hypothetical protein ENG98_03125 [Actinobacteria bacterium]|nr:hypothetical protein [Actinomycetota bacterium]
MSEIMHRLAQTIRMERSAFVWMYLNDRATGDAVLLVLVTRFLILLGTGFKPLGFVTSASGMNIFLQSMLSAFVFWLAYSGVTFAVAKYLFQGGGSYVVILRTVGFAFPTMLLILVSRELFSSAFLVLLVGSLWLLAIVSRGLVYEADLDSNKAVFSAVLGLVGWFIVARVLGWGLI